MILNSNRGGVTFTLTAHNLLGELISATTSDLEALYAQLDGWVVPWATHGEWLASRVPGADGWPKRFHAKRTDHGPREVAA